MADLIKLYQHPGYTAAEPELRKYRDLYDCKHAVLSAFEYLWPHEVELSDQPMKQVLPDGTLVNLSQTVGERLRRIRVTRTRFMSVAESIVSLWVSFLFGKDSSIALDDEAAAMLGEHAEDIDGRGTTFEDFVKWHVTVNYLLYGQPVVLVDAPPITQENRAQQQQEGWRPVMEVLENLDVKDWQLIREGKHKGKYKFIRYEYEEIEDRDSPEEEPVVAVRCRVLKVTPTGLQQKVYRQEKSAGTGEAGWKVESTNEDSAWDVVPVATVPDNESWLKGVADLILEVYNHRSALTNQLNSQAFQRIFLSGKLQDKHAISISEYSVNIVPEGTVVTVIEPSNPEHLVKQINTGLDAIFRIALNRTRTLSTDSNEAPAADTLREMREEMVTLLKSAISEIEGLMNRALGFYALYKLGPVEGAKFKGKVVLDKNLTVEDFEKQLQIWLSARDDIKKVFVWYQAMLKKIAREQKFPEDELEKIEKGIDELKPEPRPDPLAGFGPFLDTLEDPGQRTLEGEDDGKQAGHQIREGNDPAPRGGAGDGGRGDIGG